MISFIGLSLGLSETAGPSAPLGMTKGRVATHPPTFVSGMERYANNHLFRSL
jgi:hypothetical protein